MGEEKLDEENVEDVLRYMNKNLNKAERIEILKSLLAGALWSEAWSARKTRSTADAVKFARAAVEEICDLDRGCARLIETLDMVKEVEAERVAKGEA